MSSLLDIAAFSIQSEGQGNHGEVRIMVFAEEDTSDLCLLRITGTMSKAREGKEKENKLQNPLRAKNPM